MFFSPEGNERGHLHESFASTPFMGPVEDGVFLTFNEINLQRQRLLWMDHSGNTFREDTLALPFIEYAYTENDVAYLISFQQDHAQRTATYSAFAFNSQGELLAETTLLEIQFGSNESHGGHAIRFERGTLTIVAAAVRDGQPLDYKLRMVRYDGTDVVLTGPFDLGAAPPQTFFFGWAIATDPWRQTVLGYYAQTSQRTSGLRFTSFDANGMLGGLVHNESNADTSVYNGLDLFVANRSVYGLYTAQARSVGAQGGTYLFAFPLDAVLDGDDQLRIVPQTASLTAYPNPFNLSVRFEYSLPIHGTTRITIHDISGRLLEGFDVSSSSSQGHIVWTPIQLPSGTYLVRLTAEDFQTTCKLVLLK